MKPQVKVVINENSIKQKVDALLDETTMLRIQEVFAETIDPWTPFLTGQLSGDIEIDSTGVTYNVPYAKNKYYGEVYHKEVHPLATSHWDQVAMQQGAYDILKAKVTEIITERAKQLYG